MDNNTQEVKPVVAEKSEEVKVEPSPAPSTQSTPTQAQYGDEEEEEQKHIKLTGEKIKSADEEETLIYIKKAKIYRFRDGKWKERGDGYCKLLRNKDNKI